MKFSQRTQWDLDPTPWAHCLSRMRAQNRPVFDLTASNPTLCGFNPDPEAILGPLASPLALHYEPIPAGHLDARQAISRYYRGHGAQVNPADILLTASTSEAYSFLFRLLADPGEEILIAQPSYPLFDFLAQLDDVRLRPYPLFYDHGWQIDLAGLAASIRPATRAIAIVHPNNPTGHFTSESDRVAIEEICRRHGLALIVDEVFLDYGVSISGSSFLCGDHTALTFVLSGLSKIVALPQMKASWIVAAGPGVPRREAMDRLEVIADTFLSVSTPVQQALPAWLDSPALRSSPGSTQQLILDRVRANLAVLDELLARQVMVNRLEVEAGWYVVLRVPGQQTGEQSALALLESRAVAVHPGEFFGFPNHGWLVLSLLPPMEEFSRGAESLLSFFKLPIRNQES